MRNYMGNYMRIICLNMNTNYHEWLTNYPYNINGIYMGRSALPLATEGTQELYGNYMLI